MSTLEDTRLLYRLLGVVALIITIMIGGGLLYWKNHNQQAPETTPTQQPRITIKCKPVSVVTLYGSGAVAALSAVVEVDGKSIVATTQGVKGVGVAPASGMGALIQSKINRGEIKLHGYYQSDNIFIIETVDVDDFSISLD